VYCGAAGGAVADEVEYWGILLRPGHQLGALLQPVSPSIESVTSAHRVVEARIAYAPFGKCLSGKRAIARHPCRVLIPSSSLKTGDLEICVDAGKLDAQPANFVLDAKFGSAAQILYLSRKLRPFGKVAASP
jgi:hypothetical protein